MVIFSQPANYSMR